MKKLTLFFTALLFIFATACQKDDITPSIPIYKKDLIDCKGCQGSWDLTDTIP